MKNNLIIHTENLAIGYSKRNPIISDLNIALSPDSLVGLVGRNGSGKSTFIKTVSKLLDPISGNVYVAGRNIETISPKQFSKNASILLSQQFIPGFTSVYDLISLGRYPYTNYFGKLSKNDKSVIAHAIELMDIHNLKDRIAISLSDGEKQKVMLARALAQDTPILILDEPTTFLDLPSKLNFFKHVKAIHQEMNKTILIASHEWNLLADYCTDFLVFANNQVEQKTSIAEELTSI